MKSCRLILGIVSVVAVSSGVACMEEDIVLATVPKAAGPAATAIRCVDSAECGAGSFCDRRRCHEPAGTCAPFPVSCTDDEHPVCGCDGVTYFNDCLRRAAGVAGSEDDECGGPPAGCAGPKETCPEGAVCAKLQGFAGPERQVCGGPPKGRCWVLPATCPPPTRSDRWDECGEAPEALRCIGTCSAIRSGKVFVRANRCQ